jgi:hypothetical protein
VQWTITIFALAAGLSSAIYIAVTKPIVERLTSEEREPVLSRN